MDLKMGWKLQVFDGSMKAWAAQVTTAGANWVFHGPASMIYLQQMVVFHRTEVS
jgi:hypothetical protein